MTEPQFSLFSSRLEGLMTRKEGERLEFKEAKRHYDFEKLVKYCCALANEGGGQIVLGVTDKRPRKIVGTLEFPLIEQTKASLVDRLHLRIDAEEISHPQGRVLIFDVPARPLGVPIQYKGAFWMRAGESLVGMTTDQLRKIFNETGPDFSAETYPGANASDLDPAAIHTLRETWMRKSGNAQLSTLSDTQLLEDVELLVDGVPNYAALILLGTRRALSRHLGQAEIVFEYRASGASGPAQHRRDYRQGFLLSLDELWHVVNARNEVQHFQDGLFIWDIHTFNRIALREAILNAVSHRDYSLSGSIFIRQYPRRIEIVSPGGFPPGITEENILWRQSPRNRRIAEVLAKLGLVERSGQGMNLIFEQCIKEAKPKPDFSYTDEFQVFMTLKGEVQDPRFLVFLEKIGRSAMEHFTTEDFLVLDLVYHAQAVPERLRHRQPRLAELGIIEKEGGRGRGTRYMLSRRFYEFLGKRAAYTRRRGLDKDTNKALLLKHLRDCPDGSHLKELMQVLPNLAREHVQRLLNELRGEGRVYTQGRTKGARWYAASTAEAGPAQSLLSRAD